MTNIKVKTTQGYKYIAIQKADMYAVFEKYARGKDVLDLGCADYDWEKAKDDKGDFWLHGFLCLRAKNCVGIDISEEEVKSLNERGHTCFAGNVETIDLKRRFDVIIAANIIEHLSNPGLFLDNVKKHLHKSGGVVIIATPNPFFIMKFVELLLRDNQACGDHRMWFDPKTLSNLMAAHGFEITEIYWTTSYYVKPWSYFVRIIRALRGYFCTGFTVVAKVMVDT